MPRKKPAPPRREVIACTAAHLPAIQAIYNDAILNSTSLYEYSPRSEEVMREWFADRERADIPVPTSIRSSTRSTWTSGSAAKESAGSCFRP